MRTEPARTLVTQGSGGDMAYEIRLKGTETESVDASIRWTAPSDVAQSELNPPMLTQLKASCRWLHIRSQLTGPGGYSSHVRSQGR